MPRACPVDRQMLCARTARQAAWRAMRCRALTQLCTVREQWDTSSGLPVKSQTALYLLLGSHRHAQALAGSGGPQRRRSQHRPDQFAPLGHAKTVLNIGHFGACLAIFHSVCQKGTGGKCLNIRKHRVSLSSICVLEDGQRFCAAARYIAASVLLAALREETSHPPRAHALPADTSGKVASSNACRTGMYLRCAVAS